MELSDEMKRDLADGIVADSQRIIDLMRQVNNPHQQYNTDYYILEQMAYTTEQLRLKLKMLGAPRIYN